MISLALTFGAIVAAALLQQAIVFLLPRIWPLERSAAERLREQWLDKTYSEETNALAIAEYLLSIIAMVFLPFGGHRLMTYAIPAQLGDIVLFYGSGMMIFMLVIAGAFCGPFLTRLFIRARFGAHSRDLLELYARSEDRHGGAGRFILRRSGTIAAIFIVLAIAIAANRYSVVRPNGIDLARGFGRELVPYSRVRSIITLPHHHHAVVLDDGRELTTKESIGSVGALAGRAAEHAVEVIRGRSGLR